MQKQFPAHSVIKSARIKQVLQMDKIFFSQSIIRILLVVCLVNATMIIQATTPPFFSMPENVTTSDFVPGKIIFRIKDGVNPFAKNYSPGVETFTDVLGKIEAENLVRKFPNHNTPTLKRKSGGREYVDLSKIFEITVPDTIDIEEAINLLYASGYVEYAQPYFIPQTLHVPNDPMITSQYYLEKIRAFDAWGIARGDTNVVIAIVDTGIDLFHPDIRSSIAFNFDDPVNGIDCDNDGYIDNFQGWDLGENDNNPQFNTNAHGLHVAGIAGASANNGAGIAGVGYRSRILPIKVSDQDGRLIAAYEGIVYAADKGADVINLSWGGTMGAGQFGQDIINYAAINRDAVVIGAAGNANSAASFFPASYDNIISVAATDINDHKWVNSSFGNLVDVSAPGANLLSTWINSTWIPSSGTSMAAPVVAGAAAILRSHFPNLNSGQIAAQLKVTSDIIDTIPFNMPWNGMLGAGRINLYRALTETHHPFVELEQLQHPMEYYQAVNPGNTFALAATFRNLLAGASGIIAVLTSQSPHVEILLDTIQLGYIGSLQTVNNFNNPFQIRIRETIPASENVFFTIRFFTESQTFAGRQNFSMTFNLDYLTINTNQITTTINSKGNVGYNIPNFNQGVGFVYAGHNTHQSLIKTAGIMIGVSTARVVDNIYGAIEGSFTGSFNATENARFVTPAQRGDFQIKGSFNDSRAGVSRVGLKIDYNIFGFNNAPNNKFIILEYNIINTSGVNQAGLHAGFFSNWLIQDFRSHRASFDPENNMGYAFSANGGQFKGISVLNHPNVHHYAFDNQGFGGSMKISDGFTSFEKYTAMKSTRNNAGVHDKDNDISTLIGAGPFTLPMGDTLTVAFALLAGDHLMDLRSSAQMASNIYNQLPLQTANLDYRTHSVTASPNPFTGQINLNILIDKPSEISISITDITGRKMHFIPRDLFYPGRHQLAINAYTWPQGIYFVQILKGDKSETIKVVKY